uniref:Uncharacterized protein n=1 Tax=Pipistrellus kuhlii TaxID=59472 RepID=A0A7J7VVE0_PIPKU|nr:hypothetical protein mPipKuh1_008315 [Pipistrellus kuhlii]
MEGGEGHAEGLGGPRAWGREALALRNVPGCLLGLRQWAQRGLELAQCRAHVAQQALPPLLPTPSPQPGWGCQGRADLLDTAPPPPHFPHLPCPFPPPPLPAPSFPNEPQRSAAVNHLAPSTAFTLERG